MYARCVNLARDEETNAPELAARRPEPAFVRWSDTADGQQVDGVTRHQLRDSDRYERIGHGVYRSLELPPVAGGLTEIAARARRGTLCLTSALAWHNLTDESPAAFDVAIPRGSRAPALRTQVRMHRFDSATYGLGRETHELPEVPGLNVCVYSAERTIADLYRLPNRRKEAIEATRRWLRIRGHRPASLVAVGQQLPRAETRIREALAYLT